MGSISKKTPSQLSARFKTARVVLWGSLGIFGLASVLDIVLLITLLLHPPDRPIQWINLWAVLGMTATTVAALRLIKKSLTAGMWLYVISASFFLFIMIVQEHFAFNKPSFPLAAYGFHLGVLSLGLILGFKAGIGYAFLITLMLMGIGYLYRDRADTYVAIAFAFGMAFPSLIVDLLEKEVRRTEEKFSLVFREALDVLFVLDETNGQILDVNRAARVTLGYAGRDLVIQPMMQLFPLDAPLSAADLLRLLQTQDAVFGSQSFRCADGTFCPMDLTATRVPWEEGHAVLLTLRDITERQRAEEELRQHREHMEELVVARTIELQAHNLELDAYGHTVAHDLKNPLAALIGFSELLSDNYEQMETDKRQLAFNAIAQSGRKMINIIDELLLLASVRKADAVSVAPIEMGHVVKEALQRLSYLIQERQPDISLPSQWPTVWGHAPWIEEVWVNYLSNAIKYGGRPTEDIPPRLELGYDTLDFELPILDPKIPSQKSKIKFWVRDNGKGLTQEEQNRLFIPFTRLCETRAKGHGLGLSIVKRIVEKCGGDVGVESVVGQGSTFYFTLPASQASPEEQPEKLFI